MPVLGLSRTYTQVIIREESGIPAWQVTASWFHWKVHTNIGAPSAQYNREQCHRKEGVFPIYHPRSGKQHARHFCVMVHMSLEQTFWSAHTSIHLPYIWAYIGLLLAYQL